MVGTLGLTWITYMIASIFSFLKSPLLAANFIAMPMGVLIFLFVFMMVKIKRTPGDKFFWVKDKKVRVIELCFIGMVLLLAVILMWSTFYSKGNKLYVGSTVFSDFSPHIGMIRSFSKGNNFPTWYSHFAGEDIRYHFMFQFLVGNLEFLGMRLDQGFNLVSILSFMAAFLLLYLLAVKISGKISVGLLSCLFFAFRSSKTLYSYLARLPEDTNIWKTLTRNTTFIRNTPYEEWGLWNLNVYCNQRHLAFGIAVILLVILLFLPYLYEMFEHSKEIKKLSNPKIGICGYIKQIFLSKEGWKPKDLRMAVALGFVLGSLAFFHGSAVIGCVIMLFVVAIVSYHRADFMILAIITVALSVLQTRYFIHGSVVAPKFFFGFIAETKTLFGVLSYIDRLLGILPLVLIIAFGLQKVIGKYIMLAFAAPFLFAFFVSLTVDVTVNHKYIMISIIMLGIFAAILVVKLFEYKGIFIKLIAIALIMVLTATGIYDFTSVIRKNKLEGAIVLDNNDPLTTWIIKNSTSKDIFLTSPYALNQVVFGGAMLYQGWQYFGWSAGYNTHQRSNMVKLMYEADTPKKLDGLIKENNIRFIIVDYKARNSSEFQLNEKNIETTYQKVFEEGKGQKKVTVYDTRLTK